MKTMHSSKLFLTVFIVAACAVTAPVVAGDRGETVAETVAFSDLDISSVDDAKVLYDRLKRAARRVCGVESLRLAGTVRILSEQRKCYRETLQNVVASLDEPQLSLVHASNQSRPSAPLSMTANH